LFGFSSLTSLGIFASERILFMRERANGYYSPLTYFLAKVLFDIIPLRVVPPFVLGAIIYRPVGLVPTVPEFWKLILVLILFNLAASSVVFLISIVVSDAGLANLVGSLVMLFKWVPCGRPARLTDRTTACSSQGC
jgi:ABC-type multidrug transport system permease subunit